MYSSSYGKEELILQADNDPGYNIILIFGRSQSLDILENSGTWYMDGTFKIALQLINQVYVILSEYLHGILSIVYMLLPDKQSKTYDHMFSMLMYLIPVVRFSKSFSYSFSHFRD